MDASKVIIPTIGRVVWFYPHENQNDGGFARHGGPTIQPYTALITHVWSDHMVNLCVFDANGTPHGRTSVELVQEDGGCPGGGGYCTWMPFQKGQARAQEQQAKEPVKPTLPVGTVVRLKSGGPDMVFTGVHGDGVAWSAGDGYDIRRDHLPLEALEVVTPAEPIPPTFAPPPEHPYPAPTVGEPAHYTIGGAMAYLKRGRRVARIGWNGKGMWLELQRPDARSKMRRPYIFMSPVDGDLVPWVASQSDLLAEDWVLVD